MILGPFSRDRFRTADASLGTTSELVTAHSSAPIRSSRSNGRKPILNRDGSGDASVMGAATTTHAASGWVAAKFAWVVASAR